MAKLRPQRIHLVFKLAWFIHSLWRSGHVSRSRALNALDRLALRAEEAGYPSIAESVSAIYMKIA